MHNNTVCVCNVILYHCSVGDDAVLMTFYRRAMHYSAKCGLGIALCSPSVCLSLTLMDQDLGNLGN